MRARTVISLINTGTAARRFIQLAQTRRQSPAITIAENNLAEAAQVLESFRSHRRQPGAEYILNGNRVIRALDEQLRGYRSAGEEFADWVTRGSHVSIAGDDRRFTVMQMLWDREAVRVRDDAAQEYVIPFSLIGPWPQDEDE